MTLKPAVNHSGVMRDGAGLRGSRRILEEALSDSQLDTLDKGHRKDNS